MLTRGEPSVMELPLSSISLLMVSMSSVICKKLIMSHVQQEGGGGDLCEDSRPLRHAATDVPVLLLELRVCLGELPVLSQLTLQLGVDVLLPAADLLQRLGDVRLHPVQAGA